MRPAHELTEAEAVAELEDLLDHPRDTPKARQEVSERKAALELQVMLLRGQAAPTTEPDPAPGAAPEPRRTRMKFTPEQRMDALMKRFNRIMKEKGRNAARGVAQQIRQLCEAEGWEIPEQARAKHRFNLVDNTRPMAPRPIRSHQEAEPELEPEEESDDEGEEPSIQERIQALQAEVLAVTGELVALDPQDRAELVTDAANLDALAHQLAKFAATGCFEVGA